MGSRADVSGAVADATLGHGTHMGIRLWRICIRYGVLGQSRCALGRRVRPNPCTPFLVPLRAGNRTYRHGWLSPVDSA